jgi:hypothetical protein
LQRRDDLIAVSEEDEQCIDADELEDAPCRPPTDRSPLARGLATEYGAHANEEIHGERSAALPDRLLDGSVQSRSGLDVLIAANEHARCPAEVVPA